MSSDNGSTFVLATGTTTWGKTQTHGYSVSTDFNVQVKAQDRADNNSTALVRLVHYDKNATFTSTTTSSFTNVTTVTITGTTDINATCKIDPSSSVAFASMATLMSASNSGLSHSGSVSVSAGINTFYVKCQDTQANTSGNFTVSFEVNITGSGPPASSPSPPGGGTPGGSGGLPPQAQAPAIVREIVATARSFSQTPGMPDVNRLLSLVGASSAAIENAARASEKVQFNRELSVTKLTDGGKKRFESTISIHVSNIARTELRNVVVVEEVPKSIAADASQIQSTMPFTVLQSDPILSFTIDRIPANGEAIVSYTVTKEVKQSGFLTSFASAPIVSQASFDQPVIESTELTPAKPKKSPAVGSAVQSTPFPTGMVSAAVIVLVLIVGAAYWFWKRKR